MTKTRRYIILVIVLILMATNANAQRDARAYGQRSFINLSVETLKDSCGATGYGGALSFDRKVRETPLWLGIQARGAYAHDSLTTQFLAGVDMTLALRLELGALYLQPKGLVGVGMASQNRIVSNGNRFVEQFPFLALEAGGRLELGFKVKSVCFGIYAQYLEQFAEPQEHSAGAAKVEKEWLSQDPFSAGFVLSFGLDKTKRHVGGNNVPLIGAFATYGTYGLESGVKLLFNENHGLPWLKGAAEGTRGEYVASEQYGLRISETLGDIKRSSAQLGYGLFLHPTGPDAVLCYRIMVWGGLGEAMSQSAYSASSEYTNEYSGRVQSLQTGVKGSFEGEILAHFGRWCFSAIGGVSYTKVFGTQTAGIVQLDELNFETPWSFYGGLGVQFAL